MNIRKWLYPQEAQELGFTVKENKPGRSQSRYTLNDKQLAELEELRKGINTRSFIEVQKKYGKDGEILSSVEKLQSKSVNVPDGFEIIKVSNSETTGQQWVQYAKKKEEVKDFDFEAILKKHILKKPVKTKYKKKRDIVDFDTLTYTDVHVGMDTDKSKNSMYPVSWNKEEILKACDKIIEKTIQNKQSDTLIIDELGDFLDGYDGFTTRGGHKLPQNMSNEEAFDCALDFKMNLIEGLHKKYEYILCNNICNDNHAGSFGYLVNSAFKRLANNKYKNVEVTNHRKFINHYIVNDVCFLITHGKDDSSLKFGFKPFLDTKQIEKIDHYIKQNKLYRKAERFIFKKGDSHQLLFDMCTSADFDYYNYGALSPASQWVQTNFKAGKQSFVLEYFSGVENTIKPIFL